MRGHDSTLTFILPVAHCVAIRQRISVAVSVISGLMAKKCWSIDKKAMRECELMHTIVESVQQRGRHLEHTRLVRSHHHRCFSGICIETEEKYQHFLAIIPISTAGRNLRSLTFVRDDNALSNGLRDSLRRWGMKEGVGARLLSPSQMGPF